MPINYIAASIPAALLLVYVPHVLKAVRYTKLTKGKYNNVNPRKQWDATNPVFNSDEPRVKAAAQLIQQSQACHLNGWESFSMFAAGVLLSLYANADKESQLRLVSLYFAGRIVYTGVYCFTTSAAFGLLRTLSFLASGVASFSLMLHAAYV